MSRHLIRFIALVLVGWVASLSVVALNSLPVVAQTPAVRISQAPASAFDQERQGRENYQLGNFAAAVEFWQAALQAYQEQGDSLSQARVLSNLSLAYQQLGQWTDADRAISESLALVKGRSAGRLPVLAQALNNQGILQLAKGQSQEALLTWQSAADAYAQVPDRVGVLRSQINQVQALEALGLYPRACKLLVQALELTPLTCETLTLESLEKKLGNLPRPLSAIYQLGWRSLGDVLRALGQRQLAEGVLETLLAALPVEQDRSAVLLSLGKTLQDRGDSQRALSLYQQAARSSADTSTQLKGQLSQLSLSVKLEQWEAAFALIPSIQANLERLSVSQAKIYAQINLAQSLIRLKQAPSKLPQINWAEIASLLTKAVQESEILANKRDEALAIAHLGEIYERTQQWSPAQALTEKALLIAQALNAPEITYQGQWQLGRILQAQGETENAIHAYTEAVSTLQSISSDLAISPEVQFSFQETVEPIYRQLVSLLLQPNRRGEIPQENLYKARDAIESLQRAELINFLGESCLENSSVNVEQVDAQAAIVYPIILPDRLEVILSLPKQPLRHYSQVIGQQQLKETIKELRRTLVIRSQRYYFEPAQQLYQWLIRPLQNDLTQAQIQTLVFVLDGDLRNIPMAALYDGKQFLIENYAIALTPSLKLLTSQPLQKRGLQTLAAAVTEAQKGLPRLLFVEQELEAIAANVPSVILANQNFTASHLQERLEETNFPIVHIATHGQFSSNIDKTFIVAWQSKIDLRQLDDLLQTSSVRRSIRRGTPLELLVLSACETAVGDKRAALGLAGAAIQSGARSTVATLWSVNDRATAEFMGQFYRTLAKQKVSKAAALRQAQLALLQRDLYSHPFYWSPYILMGNWL
jgi:CHAT domain-containing protein/lipopolysaccharide biosynthesis regulator YciM